MIYKNELAILELFRKNIFFKETILQISKKLKKTYSRIHETIKNLENKEILNIESVGKSKQVSLNLNEQSISLISFIEEQDALSRNIPNIARILGFRDFFNDILLITGSYSIGKQNTKSDIDLVIITQENIIKKQKSLENLTDLFLPKIHVIVLSEKDFIDMLLSKEENFGKEIFKKRVIFRNARQYYYLLKGAIENGFRN